MAMTVLCSQAAADILAARQRLAKSALSVAPDKLLVAKPFVNLAGFDSRTEKRETLVIAAGWLVLAIEDIDREIAADMKGGAA